MLFYGDFAPEFRGFSADVQDALFTQLIKLRQFGPQLGRPDVDTLKGSRYPNMKELRFRVANEVWRVAFAFDPQRKAILLVGGSKSGATKERFYKSLIHAADERFESHLATIMEKRKRE
ncbi:MAG: type II toxin-antitoxin system RelE/ParE family toxin [Terracidiphilus sp.]